MDNKRVIPIGKHNYYRYYEIHKHIYRLNYEEKKRKEAENKTPKNYYYDYWRECKWRDSNQPSNIIK
jgi:hypothetical protein